MPRTKKRLTPARRSPQAKALGLRLYRPRVVPGKRRTVLNRLVQAEAAIVVDLMEGRRWKGWA